MNVSSLIIEKTSFITGLINIDSKLSLEELDISDLLAFLLNNLSDLCVQIPND